MYSRNGLIQLARLGPALDRPPKALMLKVRVVAGSREFEVARVRITEAGPQALG
jgi:hypothetical protein